MKPKIIIDKNIPFIKGVLDSVAEVSYLASADMTPDAVRDVDALIVRTRTKCNAGLLHGSKVRFIATATIGFDHIDTTYCRNHGIEWMNAPGCNARSVGQYIGSALSLWSGKCGCDLSCTTLGIVGVGHVGSEVAKVAREFGMRVLLNDPPRAEQEGGEAFVSLETICREADVITFHTPLTVIGDYPTFYLADKDFFAALKKEPLIINAARGGVVREDALLDALELQQVSDCVIDCWENEPNINFDLLIASLISTSHIAGYSADGKANATTQSVRAVSRHFNLGLDDFQVTELPPMVQCEVTRQNLPQAMLANYDIRTDSMHLKHDCKSFEHLRSSYPVRREVLWHVV